jgi:hypothetical protein
MSGVPLNEAARCRYGARSLPDSAGVSLAQRMRSSVYAGGAGSASVSGCCGTSVSETAVSVPGCSLPSGG